ncbi:amidase [Nioella sp.]|uniref:amidase n=1 Tax=Nioella sp. TaxID=1912091 RepID=UPI003519C7EB
MKILEQDALSASETARLVKTGAVSAVEMIDAAIARIERVNPALNAVIFTDFDGAREQAARLDARIARKEPVGAMAGVPTLMKDLFDFKPGWPSTMGGVPALKSFVPDFWSTYPQRMEAADAILLGKTNAPVLGFNAATDNPLFGASKNPFDLTRNTGGSSGGSAAAVASGLVPVAGATDGGGSIRIPASWCGVAGFQPSQGRVPMVMRPNAFGGASPFVYEGPVARSVADLALAMSVLAGHDPRDPFSNPQAVDFPGALVQPSLRGKRIGYTRDFGVFPVQGEVLSAIDQAVQAFADCGADLVELDLTMPLDQKSLSDLWCRLISAGSYDMVSGLRASGIDLIGTHADQLPEPLLYWMEVVRTQSYDDRQRDQILRSQVYDAFAAAFDTVDLVVSPTTAALPVPNANRGETTGPDAINGVSVNPLIGWCMTYMTNLTGHPAASIPAGLSQGLPVGLQIIGPRYGDLDVLQAAACFEQARPWADLYAKLDAGLPA